MEVILRENVDNLGKRGEIVKVADGYARNYLLPRKLALPATEGNKKHVERERKIVEVREAKRRARPRPLPRGCAPSTSRSRGAWATPRRSTARSPAATSPTTSRAKGFEIDRRKLILPEPIKTLGDHDVPVEAAPRGDGAAEGQGRERRQGARQPGVNRES